MNMKRLLAAALFLSLLLSCIPPVQTNAATEGYYTYSVSNGKATITDCSTSISGDITIPSTLGGYPVTVIGESAFKNCSKLTSVVIPNSVTRISYYAFSWCNSLTSVVIGNSVTTIDSNAFRVCNSLTSVTIPDSVTTISDYAFLYCDSLTGIWVNENNPNYSSDASGVLFNKDKTELIQAPGALSGAYVISDSVTTIGDYAFNGCSSLTSVEIPDSVTTIGDWAFYYCTSLTSVEIPDSVTTIGDYAFYRCKNLTSVVIPDSVTTISDWAFNDCESLITVEIPDSVTTIGERAFWNCTSLTGIWVNENNPNYSSDASGVLFNKDKTELIQAPGALSGAYVISDSVTTIGDYAFNGCSSLTSVEIPDSVTSIGNHAFQSCTSLNSVVIGNSVTTIGDYAFDFCYLLTSVEIPDSVTTIGERASWNCTSLTSVVIGNSVTTIGDYAFDFCYLLTSVEIPDSVTTIGERAFWNCTSLTSVEIPDSVTTIGDYAFNGCSSLTSVVIGDSVTSIGDKAFDGCTSLTKVIYCGTPEQWSAISIGSSNSNLTSALQYHDYQAATCKAPETCKYCEATQGEMSTHEGTWRQIIAPGCTDGMEARFCEVCGTTETRPIPATHYPGEYVVETPPTCLTAGMEKTTCTACGVELTQEIPQLKTEGSVLVDSSLYPESDHNYANNTNITKTFTYPGATSLTLVFSAESQTESNYDYVYIYDAAGNQLAKYSGSLSGKMITVPGDTFQIKLTSDGSQTYYGYAISSITAEGIAAHAGEWTIEKTPTCTEDGLQTRTCTDCGALESEILSATGHSYNSVVTAPTCAKDGYTTHTCVTCGDSYVDSYVDGGHNYESVVTAPTCTEQGYTTYTCAACSDTYVDSYVDAKGHSWSAWIQTVAPTCTAEGSQLHFCNCGAQETEPVAKLPHSYESVVTAPTCTAQGYTTHTCGVCGDSYVDSYVDVTEHVYEDGVCIGCGHTKCAAHAWEDGACTACGQQLIEAIDLDSDGKITAFDAQVLAEAKAGLRQLTDAQWQALGDLQVADIKNYILGKFHP